MPALIGAALAAFVSGCRGLLNAGSACESISMHRVFILSPAKTTGKRAQLLFNERASFDLAQRLRTEPGVPIGEVFSFLSGLYFRGKLAYANYFAKPPKSAGGCFVITSDAGLMACDKRVDLKRLQQFAEAQIDPTEPRYRDPLEASIHELGERLPRRCEIVLLGSIATGKYVDILYERLGKRLVFPKDFVGRGDMSRGGLLLRAVSAGTELEYVALGNAVARTGKRPPKLMPLHRFREPKRSP
jgi:hypothetical protein